MNQDGMNQPPTPTPPPTPPPQPPTQAREVETLIGPRPNPTTPGPQPQAPNPYATSGHRSSFKSKLNNSSAPPGYLARVPPGSRYSKSELYYHDSEYPGYAYILVTKTSVILSSILGSFLIFLSLFFTWVVSKSLIPDFDPDRSETLVGFEKTFAILPFLLALGLLPISIMTLFRLNLSIIQRIKTSLLSNLKFIYLGCGIFISILLLIFFIILISINSIYDLVIKLMLAFIPAEYVPFVGPILELFVPELKTGTGFQLAAIGAGLLFIGGLIKRKKVYFNMDTLKITSPSQTESMEVNYV